MAALLFTTPNRVIQSRPLRLIKETKRVILLLVSHTAAAPVHLAALPPGARHGGVKLHVAPLDAKEKDETEA